MEKRIKIAIIDSGIDINHDYLKENIVDGVSYTKKKDIVVKGQDYQDEFGHGTACASIIKKYFDKVDFYVVKIVDKNGKSNMHLLEQALYDLIDIDIDIVSLSLSIINIKKEELKDLKQICDDIIGENKIIVSSLANGFVESYPACFENVIGVKATDLKIKDSFYYNKENIVQVCIDTDTCICCDLRNSYRFFRNSNSHANAKFTAYIARIMYNYNCISNDELEEYIMYECKKNGWDNLEKIQGRREIKLHSELYKYNDELLCKTKKIIENYLDIDDNSILYKEYMFNKNLDLGFEKFIVLLSLIEKTFCIKLDYMKIDKDNLTSIFTITKIVEKYLYP